MKNYNSNNITWFVLVGEALDKINRGGSIGFSAYTDHADALKRGPGSYIQFVQSKDKDGSDKGKYFLFDESRRRFQVRLKETDTKGLTMYDFLKNHPDCEGSPNGYYIEFEGDKVQAGIVFRELNSAKDADTALEAETARVEAVSSALSIDEGTLSELGAFIGSFRDAKLADGDPDKQMRLRVLQWAEKRPQDYFKLLNSGDRPVRAIVRKAIADGTFTQKGTVIFWDQTMLGPDEDAAIAFILREPRMLEVLQKKVDLKTTVQIKNKPGRPVKTKESDKE